MIEENLKVLKKESKIKRSNFYKMLMLLLLGIVLVVKMSIFHLMLHLKLMIKIFK